MTAIKERPTKKQLRHRRRPDYPPLKPLEQVLIERPECGENRYRVEDPVTGLPQVRVLRGGFRFFREFPDGSRSKYLPKPRPAAKAGARIKP